MTARRNHGGRLRSSSASVIAHGRVGSVTSSLASRNRRPAPGALHVGAGRARAMRPADVVGLVVHRSVLSALDPIRAGHRGARWASAGSGRSAGPGPQPGAGSVPRAGRPRCSAGSRPGAGTRWRRRTAGWRRPANPRAPAAARQDAGEQRPEHQEPADEQPQGGEPLPQDPPAQQLDHEYQQQHGGCQAHPVDVHGDSDLARGSGDLAPAGESGHVEREQGPPEVERGADRRLAGRAALAGHASRPGPGSPATRRARR